MTRLERAAYTLGRRGSDREMAEGFARAAGYKPRDGRYGEILAAFDRGHAEFAKIAGQAS